MLTDAVPPATGLFATMPGVPAGPLPMAGDLAAQTGFLPEAMPITPAIGVSTLLSPGRLVPPGGPSPLSGGRPAHRPRVIVPLAGAGIVVMLPLGFLWWHLLGWF